MLSKTEKRTKLTEGIEDLWNAVCVKLSEPVEEKDSSNLSLLPKSCSKDDEFNFRFVLQKKGYSIGCHVKFFILDYPCCSGGETNEDSSGSAADSPDKEVSEET